MPSDPRTSNPCSYLVGGGPRVSSLPLASPATADPSSLLRKPSASGLGGVPWKEEEGGLRSPTWGRVGLRTKCLVRGKRMFCKFWLECPGAEQEMSTRAGSPREKLAAVSLQSELPEGSQLRPRLEFKAPSESFSRLLFPAALFFFFFP